MEEHKRKRSRIRSTKGKCNANRLMTKHKIVYAGLVNL